MQKSCCFFRSKKMEQKTTRHIRCTQPIKQSTEQIHSRLLQKQHTTFKWHFLADVAGSFWQHRQWLIEWRWWSPRNSDTYTIYTGMKNGHFPSHLRTHVQQTHPSATWICWTRFFLPQQTTVAVFLKYEINRTGAEKNISRMKIELLGTGRV